RADVALLVADADARRPGDDVVELVADRVPVPRLLLPRLEAVGVAEEVRRVDEADLLHLLRRERGERRDVTEPFHEYLLPERVELGGEPRGGAIGALLRLGARRRARRDADAEIAVGCERGRERLQIDAGDGRHDALDGDRDDGLVARARLDLALDDRVADGE